MLSVVDTFAAYEGGTVMRVKVGTTGEGNAWQALARVEAAAQKGARAHLRVDANHRRGVNAHHSGPLVVCGDEKGGGCIISCLILSACLNAVECFRAQLRLIRDAPAS